MKALGLDNPIWYGVNLWLDLVRVPPFGTWEQPRADLFGLASDWLGEPPPITEDEGIEHLVKRYLAAFGPASRGTSRASPVSPPARWPRCSRRITLRRFLDERRQGARSISLARRSPTPTRRLRFVSSPPWDATLLVQARRTQILPERYRPRIFNTKTPHSLHTFLVDGQVAGIWRHEEGRIVLEPFERLSKETRRAATRTRPPSSR